MKIAKFEFSLFGINTYVVYDPGSLECAIIDPGMSNDREREAVIGFIGRNNLKVTHLINTHLHIDHAVGNDFITRKYGVKTEAHKSDEPLGKQLQHQALMFGLDKDYDGVEISQYLEDGDVIKIGSGELKVLHVPGHSPGSIVLYDKADGFIIVGDVLFNGSVGRTDLPGGNHNSLISGIKSKLLVLPDSTEVFPGHGPATTIGNEKKYNPFLL